VAKRDRDGDIQMVEAKVDLEKAKKQGQCDGRTKRASREAARSLGNRPEGELAIAQFPNNITNLTPPTTSGSKFGPTTTSVTRGLSTSSLPRLSSGLSVR
jgi:hypothetical protein